MPRKIDVEQRRRDLAEAVWRIIRRDGLDRASVRNIATEAGLAVGSLRHYFATQSELLAFALGLAIERIEERLGQVDHSGSPQQVATRLLDELLPLDPDRRAEAEIWLALVSRAPTDSSLRELNAMTFDALRRQCHLIIDALLPAASPADRSLEAARLHALLDGLVLHGVIRPEAASPSAISAAMHHHLAALTASS